MSNDKAFSPENGNGQEFFPSDVRVVSRGPAYEGATLFVDANDMMDAIMKSKYREEQLSPGGVYTQMLNPATAVGISPSGGVMIHDHDLSFVAHSIQVSNPTSQWLWIDGADQYVAPYLLNAVFAVGRGGSQKGVVMAKTPPGFTALPAVTGELATITWHEASLRPTAGVILAPSTLGAVPAVTDTGLKALLPAGATPVVATSGVAGHQILQAILPGTAGKTTYVTGFDISYLGATSATSVVATLNTLTGGVTFRYIITVPADAAQTNATQLQIRYGFALPANAVNSPITATLPDLGAGNTEAVISITGYQL